MPDGAWCWPAPPGVAARGVAGFVCTADAHAECGAVAAAGSGTGGVAMAAGTKVSRKRPSKGETDQILLFTESRTKLRYHATMVSTVCYFRSCYESLSQTQR